MTSKEDNSDLDLKRLLTDWDMGYLYDHFVRKKITTKSLRIIQSKHVDMLFADQQLGDQVFFEHHLGIWKQTLLLADLPRSSGFERKVLNKRETPQPSNTAQDNIQKSAPPADASVYRGDPQTPAIDSHAQNAYMNSPRTYNNHTPKHETVLPTTFNDNAENSLLERSDAHSMHASSPAPRQQYPNYASSSNTPIWVASDSNETGEGEIYETNEPVPQSFHISTPLSQSVQPLRRYNNSASMPRQPMTNYHPQPYSIPAASNPAPNPMINQDIRITVPPNNRTHIRYNLQRILSETSGGQVILTYYEAHKILREEHRTALINVIARYIDANGCTLSLSESNNLENQIVEMFPTEKEEFYRVGRRGRLYNKVANMKRVYKKFKKDSADVFNAALEPDTSSQMAMHGAVKEEFVDEYDDFLINDMRSNIQNSEDFREFWERSQTARLKDIESIDSLQEILLKWPEYKKDTAASYILNDFRMKFPTASSFSEVFHTNVRKLERLLFLKASPCSAGYKQLQLYRKCSTEAQHLIILWVLHQLFPPNHTAKIDEMGIKRKKRYSIQDSQNSCICIRGCMSSIDNMLRVRTSATPPMILIIGELGGEVEEVFVYFEGVRYPTQSVVQAAELCCALFFLFNIDFPEESVLFYNFIQTFFLNIAPDVKNSKIYTTINEINACEL